MNKESKIFVNRIHKVDGEINETDSDETIEVNNFQTEVAHVNYAISRTQNLGNYNSAKISVGVQLPTYVEEINEAFEKAKKFTSERMSKEMEVFNN